MAGISTVTGGSSSWVAQSPVVIYSAMPGLGTDQSTWFNFNDLKRAVIKISSTLDQAVNVQLMGNGIQDFATAVAMGMAINIPVGGPLPITPAVETIGIGVNDDWHPYLGIEITAAVAPVSGSLTITVYSQK
jgi:hypothetical protein